MPSLGHYGPLPGEAAPRKRYALDDHAGLQTFFFPWLRGTVIGFPIGALPTGGGKVPTLLSYNVERRLSEHKDEFGKGAIEGVAGPEAANNASVVGTLVGGCRSRATAIRFSPLQQRSTDCEPRRVGREHQPCRRCAEVVCVLL
jgi:TctA family transporter